MRDAQHHHRVLHTKKWPARHAGPALSYAENANQHMSRPQRDRGASAAEARSNKFTWRGFEGGEIGQKSFKIRDKCYCAF